MHTATAQTIVYTAIVQTVGWAYASLQITPLQDIGAEKWNSRVGLYSEFYGVINLLLLLCAVDTSVLSSSWRSIHHEASSVISGINYIIVKDSQLLSAASPIPIVQILGG